MIISTTRWHYRYMRKLGFSIPRNLCPYFWKLMFALAVPLAGLAAIGVVLLAIVVFVAWITQHLTTFLTGLGVVVGVLTIIFTSAWLAFSAAGRMARTRIGRVPVMAGIGDGVSLTAEYIAAVHHKLCPVLEFVDPNTPPRPKVHGPDEMEYM